MGQFQLFPDNASTFADKIDVYFMALHGLTIFFTLLVAALITTFVFKFKRGRPADRSRAFNDHLKLEMTWTIIPLILAVGMFFYSAYVYMDWRTVPKNAQEVFVIGKQWMWHIQHKNGIRENNELTIPVGQPVKLVMTSQDVIHAFYVPAFRSQYHVVPGRYTYQWFQPTKVGKYHLFCTIHCGTQHSEMVGTVNVLSPTDYASWVEERRGNRFNNRPESLAAMGKQIYDDLKCGNCHLEKDSPRGPSLYGLYGQTRKFTNGLSAKADDDYLKEAIIDPYKNILQGYDNTMPVYQYKTQITEEQIRGLIEYMKSIGQAPAAAPATPAKTPEGRES